MYFKSIMILLTFFVCFLKGQNIDLTTDNASAEKSVRGAFGAVTIDGEIWNQIALRPIVPFGKLSIAFDFVLYIDQDGNIHDDEWDFSSGEKVKNTLIDKIYYIRYGSKWKKNYFQIGALDNVTMGYGILLKNYSNTLLYPQVRKVGMEFKSYLFGLNIHGFTNDFKETFGLTGFRVSAPTSKNINIGLTWIGDRNQYLGLRDSDNDGVPDLVDDFPNNSKWQVDTDGDGLADDELNEWDIDGDGITDTLDNQIPGWNLDTIVVLDDDIIKKPEPLDINKKTESFNSYALDIGIPLYSDGKININAYSQYAALLGKTLNPSDSTQENAGYGLIPFGVSAKVGPARMNFEYRMVPKGNFEFGYFNRSYEIERSTFKSISGNQGKIITKASKLGSYGKQNGFFASLNLDLGTMISARASYQSLNGEQFNLEETKFESKANKSFTAVLGLKKSVSKIEKASWFYQQRNVPNPFNFEFSESTIMGYNIGLNLGNGMMLTYVFRRTFNDLNGDGDVLDNGEMNNMTNIETSFTF